MKKKMQMIGGIFFYILLILTACVGTLLIYKTPYERAYLPCLLEGATVDLGGFVSIRDGRDRWMGLGTCLPDDSMKRVIVITPDSKCVRNVSVALGDKSQQLKIDYAKYLKPSAPVQVTLQDGVLLFSCPQGSDETFTLHLTFPAEPVQEQKYEVVFQGGAQTVEINPSIDSTEKVTFTFVPSGSDPACPRLIGGTNTPLNIHLPSPPDDQNGKRLWIREECDGWFQLISQNSSEGPSF